MKAKEPAAAYYTPAMIDAMRTSILRHVEKETDTARLEKIYSLYAPKRSTYSERYEKAKAFVHKHFDEEYWPEFAAHNYYVDYQPQVDGDPTPETITAWEKAWDEEEAAGNYITSEDFFKKYRHFTR